MKKVNVNSSMDVATYAPLFLVGIFMLFPKYVKGYYVGNVLYLCMIIGAIFLSALFSRYQHQHSAWQRSENLEFKLLLVQALVILIAIFPNGLFSVYNPFLIIALFIVGDLAAHNLIKSTGVRLPVLAEVSFLILFGFGLMTVLTARYGISADSNSFDELHVQSYISTIINYLQTEDSGRIEGQYGRYYLVFGMLHHFLEVDIKDIFIILKYIQFSLYALIFISLRNRASNMIIPLIVTGSLIYLIEIYRVDLDSYYYYQHYPHRMLVPVVALFLLEFFGHRRYFPYVFTVLIILLGLFWNVETAVLSIGSYYLAMLLKYFHAHGFTGLFNAIKLIYARRTAVLLSVLCCPIVIGLLADKLIIFDEMSRYLVYIKHFLLNRSLHQNVQYSAITILALSCAWLLLISSQKHDTRLHKGSVYSQYFCCIYGVVLSTYWYLNGSWIISIDFALFIIIALGFHVVRVTRNAAVSSALSYTGLQSLIVMFILFVYGLLFSLSPSPINPNIDRIQRIGAVIRDNTVPGQEVLIVTDRNFLYLNNKLKVPGRFPALTEIVSSAQVDRYIKSLQGVNTVILDPMPAYNRGIGLYKSAIRNAVKSNFTCADIGFEVELCQRK